MTRARRWWSGVCLLVVTLAGIAHGEESTGDDEAKVAALLDELHLRASQADFDGYFSLYDERAVFLGTDREEYWPLAEFKTYTRRRFATGSGWTYLPTGRHVHIAGDAAWFEERLHHDTYGELRGTGVLIRATSGWRVVQYNLTLPIPNDLFGDMAGEIENFYREPHVSPAP